MDPYTYSGAYQNHHQSSFLPRAKSGHNSDIHEYNNHFQGSLRDNRRASTASGQFFESMFLYAPQNGTDYTDSSLRRSHTLQGSSDRKPSSNSRRSFRNPLAVLKDSFRSPVKRSESPVSKQKFNMPPPLRPPDNSIADHQKFSSLRGPIKATAPMTHMYIKNNTPSVRGSVYANDDATSVLSATDALKHSRLSGGVVKGRDLYMQRKAHQKKTLKTKNEKIDYPGTLAEIKEAPSVSFGFNSLPRRFSSYDEGGVGLPAPDGERMSVIGMERDFNLDRAVLSTNGDRSYRVANGKHNRRSVSNTAANRRSMQDEQDEDNNFTLIYNGGAMNGARRGSVSGSSSVTNWNSTVFTVEHLTSFPMSRDDALWTIDDAIRKLRIEDFKNKIWSQEMKLEVSSSAIVLHDIETSEFIDKFPFNGVNHVEAVSIADYHIESVLAFIYRDNSGRKPEIYLFNCDQCDAEEVCGEIRSAMENYKRSKSHKYAKAAQKSKNKLDPNGSLQFSARSSPMMSSRSTQDVNGTSGRPPPMTFYNPSSYQGPISVRSADSPGTNSQSFPSPTMSANVQANRNSSSLLPDEEDSGSEYSEKGDMSARMEVQVDILNHCFDDIETFAQKLKHVHEARRELSLRQKKKQSKGGKQQDNLLQFRARLPPEADFIDTFQKFKLSFNLLFPLKRVIRDPSAVELVHHLFPPLRMIVGETESGLDIAQNVISPLLSEGAVQLLKDSLSSEERALWMSLGNAWTVPREKWPKEQYVPVYKPRFLDGWVPPHLESDSSKRQSHLDVGSSVNTSAAVSPSMPPPPAVNAPTLSQPMSSHQPRSSPLTSGVSRVRVTSDFVAGNYKELTVRKGEVMEVVDSSRNWWAVKNSSGQTGHVPKTILTPVGENRDTGIPFENTATFHHHMHNVVQSSNRQIEQQVLNTPQQALPVFSSPAQVVGPPGMMNKVGNVPTPPPPPPPEAMQPKQPLLKQQIAKNKLKPATKNVSKPAVTRTEDARDGTEDMHNGGTTSSPGEGNAAVINHSSTPQQVRSWLQSKGFSPLTVDGLGILNGSQLFSLSKDELMEVCFQEGPKVYSFVTVQKSLANSAANDPLTHL